MRLNYQQLSWRRGRGSNSRIKVLQTFHRMASPLDRRDITDGAIPQFAGFLPCRVAGVLFPALLLTGCSSDPSVPIGSFWPVFSFCIFLIGLPFYVLTENAKAIRLIKKLQAESTRGICTRIGTIDLNEEEGTVSLDGWSFQGGFTGFVVHGYRMSELEAMQRVEIDRVAKRAVSEVSA